MKHSKNRLTACAKGQPVAPMLSLISFSKYQRWQKFNSLGIFDKSETLSIAKQHNHPNCNSSYTFTTVRIEHRKYPIINWPYWKNSLIPMASTCQMFLNFYPILLYPIFNFPQHILFFVASISRSGEKK